MESQLPVSVDADPTTTSEESELFAISCCVLGGGLPICHEKTTAASEASTVGAECTINVTGMESGLLAAPGEFTMIVAVYWPAVSPLGSTTASTLAGVEVPLLTVSHDCGGTTDRLKVWVSVLLMLMALAPGAERR